MKLVHITERKNLESIKEKGLVINKKMETDSRVNLCLHELKSNKIKLPDFVNLDNAIYLTPYNNLYGFMMVKDPIELIVNSKDLTPGKLYCGPALILNKIIYMVQVACEYHSRKDIEELIMSAHFKKLINDYWRNFKPFMLYSAKFGYKPEVPHEDCVEVLYFDDIPPELIKFPACSPIGPTAKPTGSGDS